MEPIIVRIITFVLGSVLNKGVSLGRNAVANKLKDGDVTDENWRDAIVEDLDDIKTKIDGLARKDLLASHCFLKEGIDLLTLVLDEAKDEQASKDEANGLQDVGSTTTATTATIATATTKNESDSVDLNEAIALSNAIQKLRNASNDRLVSAKECFKAAREEATRAFCNEALKLPDRIMAAKIRVVSKILECLQDTKAATSGCMLFLKELNHLPAIGETFSTHFEYTLFSFFKSKFYKDARLENVKSVLSLNFAISEFVATFSGELPKVRNWPRIHLSTENETIHPLLLEIDFVKQIFCDEKFQLPVNHVSLEENIGNLCINSKGELIVQLYSDNNRVFILKRSGELKLFCDDLQPAKKNFGGYKRGFTVLAVDRYDNLYVMVEFIFIQSPRDQFTYVLFVFDSSGNKKCENELGFIAGGYHYSYRVFIMVNKDGDVIIHFNNWDYLDVCDSNGNLKSCLSLEHSSAFQYWSEFAYLECVADQNDLIMVAWNYLANSDVISDVLVYTKEGKLKRTISVKYNVHAVAYNYSTSKIEILVYKKPRFGTMPSFCILSYSENNDVEYLYLPAPIWEWLHYIPRIVSHPAGLAAFVYHTRWSTDKSRALFM